MKERPILFSAPMIRAVLAGTKTQTRRLVKPAPPPDLPHSGGTSWLWSEKLGNFQPYGTVGHIPMPMKMGIRCPFGVIGDRLWVRESFRMSASGGEVHYPASLSDYDRAEKGPWKPSIHMPRAASRIDLDVTGVRVERLQDITPSDAIAEGIFGDGRYATEPPLPYPVATFKKLWDSINGGRGSWASNPWVWAVSFRRVESATRAA